MIGFVYSFLFLLTSAILYISGCMISRGKVNYWLASMPGIIAYTLNEGLRFGRGVDYNFYYVAYNNVISGDMSDNFEPIFVLFIKIFGFLGVEWQGFVLFMSFLFIFSIYMLGKHFRKQAKYVLPLIPMFAAFAENIMRQAMGFSFVLIGLYYLLLGRKKSIPMYVLFVTIGTFTHSSMLVVGLAFFLIKVASNKVMIRPVVSISVYILSVVLFNMNFMKDFLGVIQMLLITERASNYGEHLEDMFSGESFMEVSVTLSAIYMFAVYFGYKLRNRVDPNFIYFYNLFIVGFITYPVFTQIELFGRIGIMFLMFISVVLGYMFFYYYRVRRLKLSNYKSLMVIVLVLNLIRTLLVPSFQTPQIYQYVWDSNGRHVLDVSIYQDLKK